MKSLVLISRPEYTLPAPHYSFFGQLVGLNGNLTLVPYDVWCEVSPYIAQVLEDSQQPDRIKLKRRK